jgi:hypothetical protein
MQRAIFFSPLNTTVIMEIRGLSWVDALTEPFILNPSTSLEMG